MIGEIVKSLQQLKRELDTDPSKEVLQAIDRELERLQAYIKRYQPSSEKDRGRPEQSP